VATVTDTKAIRDDEIAYLASESLPPNLRQRVQAGIENAGWVAADVSEMDPRWEGSRVMAGIHAPPVIFGPLKRPGRWHPSVWFVADNGRTDVLVARVTHGPDLAGATIETSFYDVRLTDVESFVRLWLRLPNEPDSWVPEVGLSRKVERATGLITRLIEELEIAQANNRDLSERLRDARAEVDQLQAIRDALLAELRKSGGPDRRSTSLLAKVAGLVILPLVLSAVGGAVAGVAQELTANRLTAEDERSKALVDAVQDVRAACQQVIVVGDDVTINQKSG